MPSELISNPSFWALAIVGVFFTGISKSGFAGGAGVVAVPLLAIVVPPATAVIIMLPLLLMMDAQTVAQHRRNLAVNELKIIIPAALLGVLVGTYALSDLSDKLLQQLLGVVSLAFVVAHFVLPQLKATHAVGFVLGGIAGITSTLIHAGGPPLNIYLAARKLPRGAWISTAAIFFASINFAKVFAYGAIGLWKLDLLLLALALSPVAIAGTWAGHRVQALISEKQFVGIVMACLTVSGTMLIAQSLK